MVIDEIARFIGVEKEVSVRLARPFSTRGHLSNYFFKHPSLYTRKSPLVVLKGVPADVFEKLKSVITISPGAVSSKHKPVNTGEISYSTWLLLEEWNNVVLTTLVGRFSERAVVDIHNLIILFKVWAWATGMLSAGIDLVYHSLPIFSALYFHNRTVLHMIYRSMHKPN